MRYQLRKTSNHLFTAACALAAVFVLVIIGSILWTLFAKGFPALMHFSFFTQITPAPGMAGGLANAILGTVIMSGIAIVIATPIGILIATYLAEFSKGKKLGLIIGFANDVLLSAPSIVIGLFIYALMVKTLHHFSALAGCMALMLIALPIIVRTSRDMLEIVPQNLRESALALGAPYATVLKKIILKSVYQGIFTGILLALARILGETAPLLFTSLNNQFTSVSLNKPIASLPVVIFQYAMSPYHDWQGLAWGGALLITLVVCILSIVSKFVLKNELR